MTSFSFLEELTPQMQDVSFYIYFYFIYNYLLYCYWVCLFLYHPALIFFIYAENIYVLLSKYLF